MGTYLQVVVIVGPVVVLGPTVKQVRVIADLPQGDQAHEHFEPASKDLLDVRTVDVRQVQASLLFGQPAKQDLQKKPIGFFHFQKIPQWLPSWVASNIDWVTSCYALFMKPKMTLEKTWLDFKLHSSK